MTEIEKINEELRNYKLFKIQRLKAKEIEFTEIKNDLVKIKKSEILNLSIVFLNVISIIFLVYNISNSSTITGELLLNIFISIILSIYLTYIYVNYNFKLKKHIKKSENAILYFSQEGEILKSNYENYVDNYLDDLKRKK